ncbi:hypothetical protein SEA_PAULODIABOLI_115 [Microbacterium phage PauloDiaboli]|nr:hypothetical protein SEA_PAULODIABOLI_115 [Microbacterium phage PauloDiaboli]QWY83965.1 hypothetical protein SEA_A3WALLY_115 [Microbacterium phage A3Wally]
MPKVLNKKHDTIPLGEAVYIGRPTVYGNPFIIGQHGDRDEVIRKYAEYLIQNPDLMKQVRSELRGKDLVCWCAPEPCHGDVLLYYANFEEY